MKSYKCKKCNTGKYDKGIKTVVWDEEKQIWICWNCGWIDKQRKKKKNK